MEMLWQKCVWIQIYTDLITKNILIPTMINEWREKSKLKEMKRMVIDSCNRVKWLNWWYTLLAWRLSNCVFSSINLLSLTIRSNCIIVKSEFSIYQSVLSNCLTKMKKHMMYFDFQFNLFLTEKLKNIEKLDTFC